MVLEKDHRIELGQFDEPIVLDFLGVGALAAHGAGVAQQPVGQQKVGLGLLLRRDGGLAAGIDGGEMQGMQRNAVLVRGGEERQELVGHGAPGRAVEAGLVEAAQCVGVQHLIVDLQHVAGFRQPAMDLGGGAIRLRRGRADRPGLGRGEDRQRKQSGIKPRRTHQGCLHRFAPETREKRSPFEPYSVIIAAKD